LLALVPCFSVTARLAGRTAAIVATAALVLANGFLYNAARGDAEGLLVALALLAVDQHLRGRPRAALVAGGAAGLIRPRSGRCRDLRTNSSRSQPLPPCFPPPVPAQSGYAAIRYSCTIRASLPLRQKRSTAACAALPGPQPLNRAETRSALIVSISASVRGRRTGLPASAA